MSDATLPPPDERKIQQEAQFRVRYLKERIREVTGERTRLNEELKKLQAVRGRLRALRAQQQVKPSA